MIDSKERTQVPRCLREKKRCNKHYDKDDSGFLDVDEMFEFLGSMGQNPSQTKAQVFCNNLDSGGDGRVDCTEFVKWLHYHTTNHEAQTHDLEGIANNIYKLFDTDGNGFVTRPELSSKLQQLGVKLTEEQERLFLTELDSHGDGEIHNVEFLELMEKYHVEM